MKKAKGKKQPPQQQQQQTKKAAPKKGGGDKQKDGGNAKGGATAFYCDVCDVKCAGAEQLAAHNAGKKHIKAAAEKAAKEEALQALVNYTPHVTDGKPNFCGWVQKSTKSPDDETTMTFERRWMEIKGGFLTYCLAQDAPSKGIVHLAGMSVERVMCPAAYDVASEASHSVPCTPNIAGLGGYHMDGWEQPSPMIDGLSGGQGTPQQGPQGYPTALTLEPSRVEIPGSAAAAVNDPIADARMSHHSRASGSGGGGGGSAGASVPRAGSTAANSSQHSRARGCGLTPLSAELMVGGGCMAVGVVGGSGSFNASPPRAVGGTPLSRHHADPVHGGRVHGGCSGVLNRESSCFSLADSAAGRQAPPHHEFVLELKGGGLVKELHLSVESEEDLEEWRAYLHTAIALADEEERQHEEASMKAQPNEVIFEASASTAPTPPATEGALPDPPLSPSGGGRYQRPSLIDFELLTTIGRGGFGKVLKVKRHQTSQVYAMKVIKKEAVIRDACVDKIQGERNSLAALNHPFLCSLQFAFQTSDALYLVTHFYPGGDLLFHLTCKKEGFPEAMSLFYTAQLTLALGYLHAKHILYRDLKPANVVLGADGYCVLTDFGMAKRVKRKRTNSFCGTDCYIAPEIVAAKEYSNEVDWWSLGVLAYEMISGTPPFVADNPDQIYHMIETKDPAYDSKFSEPVRSLLNGLLAKEESARLRRSKAVQAHPAFSAIDFDALLAKTLPAPFLPKLGKSDTRYFSAKFTNERVGITKCNPVAEAKQLGFKGFSYPRLSVS